MRTRSAIRGHIVSNGKKLELGRTWEQLGAAKDNALLLHSTASGLSDWFAIVEGKSIWWASTDTTDGGIWGPNGTVITAYSIPYDDAVAEAINTLIKEDRKKKLSRNPYAQIK